MDWPALLDGRPIPLRQQLLRWVLRAASIPYAMVIRLRNVAYQWHLKKVQSLPVPVISVGNLTAGGTGKTPCVAWLCRKLRAEGIRVSIVSRGYGVQRGPNDEALELEAMLPDVPHVQDRDRIAAATIAIEELDTQLIVLDDAFQHRRIHRDLDIVLIDCTRPWGGGWCLPGGLLREPISSLRRASLIILTRCNLVAPADLRAIDAVCARVAPQVPRMKSRHQPTALIASSAARTDLQALRDARVIALSAIGNPDAFERTIETLGATIVDRRRWDDHHPFDRNDIAELQQLVAKHQPTLLVCTRKDLVKLQADSIGGVPLRAIEIEWVVEEGEEILDTRLKRFTGT
jgi:tetraacyldisaccharide 4'-kinase